MNRRPVLQQGRSAPPFARVKAPGSKVQAFLLLVLAVVPLCGAAAQTASEDYEARLVRQALVSVGREPLTDATGLRIRDILILPRDIIAPDDPYPTIFNVIHITTRADVIERELLFSRGELYHPSLIEETERNLRRLHIIAAARIVPLRTDEPGTVDVLVVTRDLWSIRFNMTANVVGSLLQHLRVRPTEQNFLGRDKQLALDLEYALGTFGIGQEYVDRRLWGSRLAFDERARILLNRATGRLEGTDGRLRLGRPVYSLQTQWGFESAVAWNVRRERLFRGAAVFTVEVPGGRSIPWVYDRRALDAVALYTRAFGTRFRAQISAGPGLFLHRFLPPEEATQQEAQVLHERVLPVSEDAAFVVGRMQLFEASYRVLRSVETFALSEDYQVGPSAKVEVRAGRFLSAGSFAEGGASVGYRVVLHDSVTSARIAAAVRRCVPECSGEAWVNRRFAAELFHVTPSFVVGRVALRAMLEVRSFDLDRPVLLLGGANGLRGSGPESQSGTRLFLFNAEYRTPPVDVSTLHLGGVVFWDAGAAWTSGPPRIVHTVGVGVRALFPQFDVEPFRFDYGEVVNGTNLPHVERLSGGFGQVTRYRPKLLDQPLE